MNRDEAKEIISNIEVFRSYINEKGFNFDLELRSLKREVIQTYISETLTEIETR